ncbi:MAG TPA: ABC transporter permease [Acidimicrobiales bacterium]
MGAIRFALRAQWRIRWRSWLVIAVLISVVGGFVLAATAAGQRTQSAFPSFVSRHGFDVILYTNQPEPKIVTLPGVTSATELVLPNNGQPTCACTHPINGNELYVAVALAKGPPPFKLVSGHLPDQSASDQVLASYNLQQDNGVQIGTVIHVPLYSSSQSSALNNQNGDVLPRPRGPTVALHVVGIEATEDEFPTEGTPTYSLYGTRAFARTVLTRTALYYQYFIHLRHGQAALPRFEFAINRLQIGSYADQDVQATSIEASIHPQAIGWWILALLAALVGLAVIGQAMSRQTILESQDYPTMAALGADRSQLAGISMARAMFVALAGAVGAVVVATALSPIAPLGEARTAETSTGFTFDTLVLTIGALAIVGVVIALAGWPALRAARLWHPDDRPLASRPSPIGARLAASGAPPSAVIGVGNALDRKSRGSTVPVGSALLGTVLAVVALCGTLVFGASLAHLTSTPALYGEPFQLDLNTSGGPAVPALLRGLEHDPAVTRITAGIGSGEITINDKVVVGALAETAVRGRPLFSTVDGHLPDGDGQVGLGAATMGQAGAHLGSVVSVTLSGPSGQKRSAFFRVVSQVSFPEIEGAVSLGNGALFTNNGLSDALLCPPGPARATCRQEKRGSGILAGVEPGPQGQAIVNDYLTNYSALDSPPSIPTSLVNFGQAVNFPLIFGVMLAVFGAATLMHLLVVSVSRRRRETGLLRVLGFVNHQVASVVAWQATTLAVVGIIIGVPLGVVVGKSTWNAFASHLGVVPVPVVPIGLFGVLAASVVVAANLLAVVPALAASRPKPALLLRES